MAVKNEKLVLRGFLIWEKVLRLLLAINNYCGNSYTGRQDDTTQATDSSKFVAGLKWE